MAIISTYGTDTLDDTDFIVGTTAAGLVKRFAASEFGTTGRELLTANRTYYSRSDGSDSNTGLVNNSGGAFLTVQKAVDVVCNTLDLGGFDVTIQRTGAVAESVVLKDYLGATATINAVWGLPSGVKILGDRTTLILWEPSSTTSNAVQGDTSRPWILDGFKWAFATSAGFTAVNAGLAPIYVGKVEFGAWTTAYHMGGNVRITEDYTISGGAIAHRIVSGFTASGAQDHNNYGGATVTLTGTPAFSQAFVVVDFGYLEANGITYSGSATGKRYEVSTNGVVQTFGSGANYFPGNAAGTAATGGQYV